jgi:hypothetical protein
LIGQQKIELQLSKRDLMKSFLPVHRIEELIGSMPIAEDAITLEADAQFKRCGGEVRLLLTDDPRHDQSQVAADLFFGRQIFLSELRNVLRLSHPNRMRLQQIPNFRCRLDGVAPFNSINRSFPVPGSRLSTS